MPTSRGVRSRLQALQQAGEIFDPREAQIARLKTDVAALKTRLAAAEETTAELSEFCSQALAQLAAQHEVILHLRRSAATIGTVTRLPAARTTTIGPCS